MGDRASPSELNSNGCALGILYGPITAASMFGNKAPTCWRLLSEVVRCCYSVGKKTISLFFYLACLENGMGNKKVLKKAIMV